jgi:hypothetical protein
MKAIFDETNCWVACSVGILTLSAFLEIFALQSRAQSYATLLEFTADTNRPARPVSVWHSDTNSVVAVLTWTRPAEEGTILQRKLVFERIDEKSLSSILEKVGTERAESTLGSAQGAYRGFDVIPESRPFGPGEPRRVARPSHRIGL